MLFSPRLVHFLQNTTRQWPDGHAWLGRIGHATLRWRWFCHTCARSEHPSAGSRYGWQALRPVYGAVVGVAGTHEAASGFGRPGGCE